MRARWFVADAIVSATLVFGPVATLPEAASAAPAAAQATAPIGFDHSSRAAMRAAYLDDLGPALNVPIGWTGRTAGCQPGAPSAAAQAATLTAVNFFREMSGLPGVTFDPDLSAKAQAAALMMEAQNALSHSPGPSWACSTPDGTQAAGRSNLALGASGAGAIDLYMDDPGSANASVGHRRWVLDARLQTMGSGSTGRANALYVVGGGEGPVPPSPTWLPWPTPGYFPAQLLPGSSSLRWSVFPSDGDADFSNAGVTVARGGVAIPVNVVSRGSSIVWELDAGYALGDPDQTYTVTIANVVKDGAPTSLAYPVTLFDADIASPPTASPSLQFVPLSPARLLDSRVGEVTVDGGFAGIGLRVAGSVTELDVLGRGGVAGDASAVVVNVTATDTQGPGFVTVWPCGQPMPTASSLNFVAGQTVANAVVAKVGVGGKVCLFTVTAADLIVDVSGSFSPVGGSSMLSLSPARLLDSRVGEVTVDGGFAGIGLRVAGSVTELDVLGRGGVAGDASAVVVNVTATDTQGPGFVTVWPCGQPMPTASSLNFVAGQTVANAVVAKVGVGGKVCLFTVTAADLIVDVSGSFGS